ncbi:DNA polymerase phi, partial [Tremellales sp. Uapishka_1]
MTSNVLPLFWHLASSSKDTRLSASADLVSTVQTFQESFVPPTAEGEEESDDDDDDDDESGMEVDESDDEEEEERNKAGAKLDKAMARSNSEDVVYCVKRLVRGLGSSRESSRLGFAVALTELLSRISTVSPAQVFSLIMRNSQFGNGGKGSDERDMMFARLFGLTSLIQSGALFSSSSTLADFENVVDQLLLLGQVKAWLRESSWWALIEATRGLLESKVEWKKDAEDGLVEKVFTEDKQWTQEKVAIALVLQEKLPKRDWKSLLSPAFKHTPLLTSSNLVTLARILKETDGDDDEAGSSHSTGSWKPQLHFVWTIILDSYFPHAGSASSANRDHAPFQDLFRVIVDESLFSNTSSAERKYWGFQVFERSLPLLPPAQMPLIFTPNFMRCWMNNLSSPDRYLHKAALQIAKLVQDVVKENPKVGFTLLSQLVGKHGRPDFDKVTKTKTVESIMGALNGDGVADYVLYLQTVILAEGEKNGLDAAGLEERRIWALDQLLALCRNGSIPKEDAWISSLLDFLLVHGFFIIRKVNKKSNITALHTAPKPAFSEVTAAICRARFFACAVEVTTASNVLKGETDRPARQQGSDTAGKLWLERCLETVSVLEKDQKHVEMVLDADEEIKSARKGAVETIVSLRQMKGDHAEVARGVEVLLSYLVLQTYDENEDALEMLEEAKGAAAQIFEKPSKNKATADEEEEAAPIDTLLDILVALLDKGSSDLRSLANLVVGMVAAAFTSSSIQHMVAQLEQSVASAAAADEEDEDDIEDTIDDEEDSQEDEDEDEEEEESSSDEGEDEEEEEDDMAPVDAAFRQRVAEALQVSGMDVDGKAGEEEDASDTESEEIWDDEQMMKVDAQLAAVFKDRAGSSTKKTDLKHLQIESLHFKNRILDFFDTYARKQPSNPLVLEIISPLLNLVRATGSSETELANKAAGILRSRLGKAKDFPTVPTSSKLLQSIHELARKASTEEFSSLCSACSLFVTKALDDSTDEVVEAYRATLKDFMTRKASLVHANFILDFVKRFPVKAWELQADLCAYVAPGAGVNAYRQTQAYSMLQTLAQLLTTISKQIDASEIKTFISKASGDVYTTLESATEDGSAWNAARLKDVCKFALQLARASKSLLEKDEVTTVFSTERLAMVITKFKTSARTKEMKSIHGLLHQLSLALGGSKPVKEKKTKTPVSEDVEMTEPTKVTKKRKSEDGEKKVKKVKAKEGGEKKRKATA